MSDTTSLCDLPATEAVRLLKAGEVSPLDLVEAAIARIEAVDPQVNALPIRFFERAREAARRFRTDSEGRERPGWLGGLPIAVKDYNDVGGERTTLGSPIYADNVPARSDATVRRLEENGAIPLAKANVPEFAGANTFNPLFGATRTPFDLRMTAGGSSGGSAAALATGQVWLATGNDLGGSLRIPASFCGIVGMRPSVGRVLRPEASLPFDPLWVEGPMGRSVADVALMLDAEAGEAPHDPLTYPAPATSYVAGLAAPPRSSRAGFSADLGLAAVDPEVAAICRAAASRGAEAGLRVEEACPDLSGAIETFEVLRALLMASLRGPLLEEHRDRINPDIRGNIDKGLALTGSDVARAERQRLRIVQNVASFFERFDLLLCPTVAVPPFPSEQPYPTEIGGRALTSYIDWMVLTFAITVTGCPALSIPCGLTASGLPVGLQIVGPPRGDAAVLAAAQRLEAVLGFKERVPIAPAQARA